MSWRCDHCGKMNRQAPEPSQGQLFGGTEWPHHQRSSAAPCGGRSSSGLVPILGSGRLRPWRGVWMLRSCRSSVLSAVSVGAASWPSPPDSGPRRPGRRLWSGWKS